MRLNALSHTNVIEKGGGQLWDTFHNILKLCTKEGLYLPKLYLGVFVSAGRFLFYMKHIQFLKCMNMLKIQVGGINFLSISGKTPLVSW